MYNKTVWFNVTVEPLFKRGEHAKLVGYAMNDANESICLIEKFGDVLRVHPKYLSAGPMLKTLERKGLLTKY